MMTRMEVIRLYLTQCNLSKDLAHRPEWRNIFHIADPNMIGQGFDDDDQWIDRLACSIYSSLYM